MKHTKSVGKIADQIIGVNSHEFSVWTDQYDQRPVWRKSAGKALAEAAAEIDAQILQKIIKEVETSSTNSSLMVYTSSVNSTNIEDRTMTTVKAAEKTLRDLEQKLDKEARRVHYGTYLTADVRPTSESIDFSLEGEAFRANMDRLNHMERCFFEGKTAGDVVITVRGGNSLNLTQDFLKEVDEFKRHIINTYAVPMKDARRKLHLIRQQEEAQQKLERLDEGKQTIGDLIDDMF